MNWLQWCLVFSIISLSWATVCPKGNSCKYCEPAGEGEYKIPCGNKIPNFMVSYKPEEYLIINCMHKGDLTTFDLGSVKKVKPVKELYFTYCTFSEKVNLGTIVTNIFNDTVEEMSFDRCTNLLTVLTQEGLKDFKKLRSLDLSHNKLSNMTSEPFKVLPNLTVLNFAINNLNELPPNLLNIPSLKKLELGLNKLKVFKRKDIENLRNLYFLNLWRNEIVRIEPNAFNNNRDLESIDLSGNKLTSLPPGIFSELLKLKEINLSINNFTVDSFPVDLFLFNKMLETLTMTDNQRKIITLPSGFLSNLTNLKTVMLIRNGFNKIPENLLWGAVNLQSLQLGQNSISEIPQMFFRDCKNLIDLDMSENKIEHLPDKVFSSLKRLQILDLSGNHIQILSLNQLTGLSSLETLKMNRNDMIQIDGDAFKDFEKLRFAYFSNNQLNLINDGFTYPYYQSPFHSCESTIKEIHLDHNNITIMFHDWILMTNLTKLKVDHNKISHLNARDLIFFSRKIDVNLADNQIETIDMGRDEYNKYTEIYPHQAIINIGNNPLKCDCQIYDLLQYLEGKLRYQRNRFSLQIDDLKCHSPEEMKNFEVRSLKSKNFTCMYHDAERNDKSCPSKCECKTRQSDNAFLVDCSFRGLTEAPKPFSNPGHYVEMNLTGNYLKAMPSLKQQGYENITILNLNNNNISSIGVDNLSDTLEELYLDNNNMTELDSEVWKRLKNSTKIKHLTLHDNPWKCDCETRELFEFIQYKRIKIPELQNVVCRGTNTPIFSTTLDEFCPVDLYWIIGICVGIALFGILIGGVSAWYYRYQHEIKVWLYAHQWCLWFVTESELDKDKTYDAFISFSHKDEDFVVNELVSKLEQGPRPFKLCVHYRDWLAGEWIPQQIARSVDESRRTIVVLSPNFLESIWGKMEFRAAHNQALSDGRARVIVILYGDIQPSDITDPELNAYLTMNTYVQWGDPWFWDKLRYALPHSKDVKSKKKNKFENHQPTTERVDEKKK